MAVVHKQKGTITPSGGVGSATILVQMGMTKQVYVAAATDSTTFNVKLTDIHSLDVYEMNSLTGKLNQVIEIPAYGNYTLTISNASGDEEFTYLITVMEKL